MKDRKKFTAEYKREAVGLTKSSDKSISQVARDLGLEPNILSRWCREGRKAGEKAYRGQGNPQDEEVATLRRELAQVKKERDFLKEAAAFFARASK